MRLSKKHLWAILLSGICTLLVFGVHLKKADSMLSEESLAQAVSYHKENPVFIRRPLTTLLVDLVSSLPGLSTGLSFVLVNFFFLFLNGLLVFRLSAFFTQSHAQRLLNMLLYFLSAPVLFAFYQPVYSYDEPIQYFFMFLSLWAVLQNRTALFVLFFFMALVTRETSVMALLLLQKPEPLTLKKLWPLVVPPLLYVAFLALYIPYRHIGESTRQDTFSRFGDFVINFANGPHILETALSLVMVLGLPAYLLLRGKTGALPGPERKMVRAFVLTAALNTVLILLTAKAREFRLFALPLCFLWPVAAVVFSSTVKALAPHRLLSMLQSPLYLFLLTVCCFANYGLSIVLYRTSIGNPGDNYFNEYLFVLLLIISLHALGTRWPGGVKTQTPGK